MPNGRTDIFEIKKNQLISSIRVLRENEEIGFSFIESTKPIQLSELKERVMKDENLSVAIEEQWHEYYIIRIGIDIDNWVSIAKDSRLFYLIKQLQLNSGEHG